MKQVQGKSVWVSVPFVDKISIIGSISDDHLWKWATDGSNETPVTRLTRRLATGAKFAVTHTRLAGGSYAEVVVTVGDGPVHFTAKKAKGAYRLRMELNPSRLGNDGMFDLIDSLKTVYKFNIGAFLQEAAITRLDVAVDIVGLHIAELLVSSEKQGKRVLYLGEGGALESVYVHRVSKSKKRSLPPLDVKLYDKVQERLAFDDQPPFGQAPVTRMEVVTNYTSNKLAVAALPTCKNLISGRRVGHLLTPAICNQWQWLSYADARRHGGPKWAADVFGYSQTSRDALEAAYQGHISDVVDPAEVWPYWSVGLELCGAQMLCDTVAEMAS